ncbi:MAG: hypothetical protein QW035_04570 [Candidatus Anstonellales archaeon]
MAEEESIKVEKVSISAELKGDLKEVAKLLSGVSYLEVAHEGSSVSAAHIETVDINKKPYLFYIVTLKKDSIEMHYTIPPKVSPIKREVEVVKYLFNILELLSPYYSIKQDAMLQVVESAIEKASEIVSEDMNKLYVKYDHLRRESEDLKKRMATLQDSNERLSKENYVLKERYDAVKLKLDELERLPDSVLKVKLQDWLIEHHGKIDICEFASVYKVPETRVESALKELVEEGYLAPKD